MNQKSKRMADEYRKRADSARILLQFTKNQCPFGSFPKTEKALRLNECLAEFYAELDTILNMPLKGATTDFAEWPDTEDIGEYDLGEDDVK